MVGVFAWYRLSNDAAVRKLEAAARKRGEPVTLAELSAKYPPIADNENAAIAITELWEEDEPAFWKAFHAGTRPLPGRRPSTYDPDLPFLGRLTTAVPRLGVLSQESRSAAEAFVSSNRVRSAAIQNALRNHPRVRFQAQIMDGLAMLLPHLSTIKVEAQQLRIATLLATDRGDITAAIDSMRDTLRLANTLKNEPFLISQLVRIAIHGGMITECERLLSRCTLSAGEFQQLAALLASMEMSGTLKDSFIAERASALNVYQMSDASWNAIQQASGGDGEEPISPTYARLGFNALNLTGIVSADRRFLLETMEQLLGLAEKNSPESLAEIDAIFDRLEKRGPGFPPKLISALMLPGLRKTPTRFATIEARRRSALVALALVRYRMENENRLPVQLDELAPKYLAQVPTDPFDGRALRFRSLEKGFVVYSVGADRADNSGRERPTKSKPGQFDETFFVER